MQNLKNRRVMVTGGSSGLGLGVVEALAARGAKVMVVARDAQRLAEVEDRFGVVGAVGDVTDRALAVSLLQEVRPTVLVVRARCAWAIVVDGAHPERTAQVGSSGFISPLLGSASCAAPPSETYRSPSSRPVGRRPLSVLRFGRNALSNVAYLR